MSGRVVHVQFSDGVTIASLREENVPQMNGSNPPNAARHPSWIEHVIAVGVTLLILEQHSRLPEAFFFVVVIAFVAVVGLVVGYGTHLVQRLRGGDGGPKGSRWRLLHWLVLPTAVVLMLTSAATHWPAVIRFALSRTSFEQLVAQEQADDHPQGFPRRVGLYWIESLHEDFYLETRERQIGFVTGVSLIDECGIYYDPSDRRSSHYLTTRIVPGWYLTEW